MERTPTWFRVIRYIERSPYSTWEGSCQCGARFLFTPSDGTCVQAPKGRDSEVGIWMFHLILTVLNRDFNRGTRIPRLAYLCSGFSGLFRGL